MEVDGSSARANLTVAQLKEPRNELENDEGGDKMKSVNLWKQLMSGNEWFPFRLPGMVENGDDIVQFFRPPFSVRAKPKDEEVHCDLCVGGKPAKEISVSTFLQMYEKQCGSIIPYVNTSLPLCTCLPKNLRKYFFYWLILA